MCNKAVDAILKCDPDWFTTGKMIKKISRWFIFYWWHNLFLREILTHPIFSGKIDILSKDLNNINLVDVNFDEGEPEPIILVRLMVWHKRFKQRKAFKKYISKEPMPAVWHPTRRWEKCMSQNKNI